MNRDRQAQNNYINWNCAVGETLPMKTNELRRPLIWLLALVLVLALAFIFAGGVFGSGSGASDPAQTSGPAASGGANHGASPAKARMPAKILPDWEFTIISTGDIMMHSPQMSAGRQQDGGYDFAFMFEKVAPLLREGDLVVGNLETPLAGAQNGGYSGYPLFNAPEILAKNLKDAGFTLLSFANNHTLDRRFEGMVATLDSLDEADLLHTGAFRTQEERERILHFEVAGVRIAALAATYGTNGLVLPAGREYGVYYIHEASLLADIGRARAEGAQYVIVMLHWGVEYLPRPNQEQTRLAMSLLRGGADLILGNHPHVLQRGEIVHPAELYAQTQREHETQPEIGGAVTPPGGDGEVCPWILGPDKVQQRVVMYSQGNFVSNQTDMEMLSSMLLRLTIGVDGASGEPYFKEAGYIPIYTQKRNRQGAPYHTVWPLELALAELQREGHPFNGDDKAAIPRAWEHVRNSQPALDLLTLHGTSAWSALTSGTAGE